MNWETGNLPLRGVRVLDWTLYWAGPYLGMMLHDLGAEVIKVESPSNWDPLRTVIDVNKYDGKDGKPLTPQERANVNQHFNEWNRGKLGVALELADPRGRELLLRLAAEAQVFIENHRPGVKKKLGIGYEELAAVRPDMVYLSLSGFGQTLPERDAMALGAPVELASSLFSLNGYEGSSTPAKTGFSYGDPVGALTALSVVLLAVRAQRKTGQGQYVDIAMRDTLAFGIGSAFTDWSMNRAERRRRGSRHPVFAPQGVYRALGDDEWVAISVRDDAEWLALQSTMGMDEGPTAADTRRARHDKIDREIEAWTSMRTARDAEALLQAAGVPAAAVLDYQQLAEDPQLAARGAFQTVEHPAFGTELRASSQWQRGDRPQPIDAPAPCFGQHNRQVLTGVLGMTDSEVDQLARDGVIADQIRPVPD